MENCLKFVIYNGLANNRSMVACCDLQQNLENLNTEKNRSALFLLKYAACSYIAIIKLRAFSVVLCLIHCWNCNFCKFITRARSVGKLVWGTLLLHSL